MVIVHTNVYPRVGPPKHDNTIRMEYLQYILLPVTIPYYLDDIMGLWNVVDTPPDSIIPQYMGH